MPFLGYKLMFSQLEFCFTKCSLANTLLGMTKLKNEYYAKTQL